LQAGVTPGPSDVSVMRFNMLCSRVELCKTAHFPECG
jgi:hypothetical protein